MLSCRPSAVGERLALCQTYRGILILQRTIVSIAKKRLIAKRLTMLYCDEMFERGKIRRAVSRLSVDERKRRDRALAEGHKEEVCKECDVVVFAHQQNLTCGLDNCQLRQYKRPAI